MSLIYNLSSLKYINQYPGSNNFRSSLASNPRNSQHLVPLQDKGVISQKGRESLQGVPLAWL